MIKAIVNNGKVEVNIKGEDRAEMLTELAYLNYGALKGMADEWMWYKWNKIIKNLNYINIKNNTTKK